MKYSQNYYFFIFYFVSIEVGTAALKIFCVMIPSLVDTSLDFGLFRVVRPYSKIVGHYNEILDRYKMIVYRYNGLVDRYNGLVDSYNGLVDRCKGLEDRYSETLDR